jgi:hypothetical protein
MIRPIIQLVILTLVVLACEEQTAKGTASPSEQPGTATIDTDSQDQNSFQRLPSSPLPGTWAMKGSNRVSFVLSKDSLFYPQRIGAYKYKATPDSIHFYMDGYVNDFAWEMHGKDTLEMRVDSTQGFLYYRMK